METSTAAGYTMVVQKGTKAVAVNPHVNYNAVQKAAAALRAVNHKARRQIIKLLAEHKKLQVTEIYTQLNLLQAIASRHLAVLRKANIVKVAYTDRDCRIIYYSLNHDSIADIALFSQNIGGQREA